MKKVVVFGASGGTGVEVVKQLLANNFEVSAILRNPSVFSLKHSNLKVIKGDVLQPDTFRNELIGMDSVVSCLGVRTRGVTNVYSKGTENILDSMGEANIKRIICLSALAVIIPPKGSWMLKFIVKNLLQKMLKEPYADMLQMEESVSSSGFDWTIIRPPWLRNGTHTGKYRFTLNEYIHRPNKISRADLADFIVNHLYDTAAYRAFAEISY